LSVIDCYSKYYTAVPLTKKTGEAVALALKKIMQREGSPAILQSDNGKEFVNSSMVQLSER
jgi:transposase InsO family protein